MSRQRHGNRLTRSANWLIFRAWPSIRHWLRVLHRMALVVALVLSLLAMLVTLCHHGVSDRARDIGAEHWTTRDHNSEESTVRLSHCDITDARYSRVSGSRL